MAVDVLARNWWMFALRGVLALIIGVVAFLFPSVTLVALLFLFAAYVLVDGILTIAVGVRKRATEPRWWLLILEGIAGLAIGVLTFVWPQATALVLLSFVAAWAIFTGVLEFAAALRLRKEIEGEIWLALGGIASVVFGILLVVFPRAGVLTVVWVVGAYAIVFGVALILLGFRLRSWGDRPDEAISQPT